MKYEKALAFVKNEYRKKVDITNDSCINELTGTADILREMGFGLEYLLTAIFRNIFRDTETTPEEVLDYSNMDVLEAVRLINRPLDCNMIKHMQQVKSNMLALPVKLAEHLYELRSAVGKTPDSIKELLEKSDKYYMKCAQETIFNEPIFKARMILKS